MATSDHKVILSGGRFSNTTRLDLARAFQKFAADPNKDRLVLHFHGGLVPEQAGEAIAERLLLHYRKEGNAYPLFTIWQSGLLETVRNNWRDIAREDIFPALIERVTQYLLGQLDQQPGERGDSVETPTIGEVKAEIATAHNGREPLVERDPELPTLPDQLTPEQAAQFAGLLGSDERIVQGGVRLVQQDVMAVSPELQRDIEKSRAAQDEETRGLLETGLLVRAGVRIISRCLVRYAKGSHHGLYTTVVEETARELKGDLIGGAIWKQMKQDTARAFAGPADTHGGSALLEEIAKLAPLKPRVVLVGHSTGAVYICHFLQAVQEKKLPPELTFEVLFLAPACTFDLLAETLKVAGGRIAKFRSFAMQDTLEINDHLLAPIYMRSLLYFVSGLVEDEVDMPLVGMQRYHNAPFAAREKIKNALNEVKTHSNAWLWSKANGGLGLSTLSISHGDFDNNAETLASIAHLVSTGAYA